MDMEPFKRLMVCPYAKIIYEIIKPFVHKLSPQYEIDLMSVWTILTVNPEPILLQVPIYLILMIIKADFSYGDYFSLLIQ